MRGREGEDGGREGESVCVREGGCVCVRERDGWMLLCCVLQNEMQEMNEQLEEEMGQKGQRDGGHAEVHTHTLAS